MKPLERSFYFVILMIIVHNELIYCKRLYNVGDFFPSNDETNSVKSEAKSSGPIRDVIKRNSPRFRRVLIRDTNKNVIYSNEDARYMTSRTKGKLDTLASLVYGRTSQKLEILKAWTDQIDKNEPLSLHYEGRALLVTVEDTDYLGLISEYATEAGFDWVWYKNKDYLHISVKPDVCQTKLDLTILVDTSGSVGIYNFRRVKTFLKTLIDFFNIGANETHVALISYSYSVRVEFPLDRFFEKSQMKSAIDNIWFQGSNTATGDALMRMVKVVFSEEQGMRTDKSIPKIGILMTDGKSNGRGYDVSTAVEFIKKANINMFVVGITRSVKLKELHAISSEPVESHYIAISKFTDLAGFVDQISTKSCDEGAKISQCEDADSQVDGGSFKYFRIKLGETVQKVTVEVKDIKGRSYLYTSLSAANPGPLSENTVSNIKNISPRTLSINLPSGKENILYIGIQGQEDINNFKLSIWDDLFEKDKIQVSLKEGQSTGIRVAKVKVKDSGSFTYSLKDGNEKNHFEISKYGEVKTAVSLDHETQSFYQLSVIAEDDNEKCHKGLILLEVNVIDINDNKPQFEKDKYYINVREDAPLNSYLTKVRASDRDSIGELRYKILPLTYNNVFAINPISGVVTLNKKLDFEKEASYTINLRVSDGGLNPKFGSAKLQVNVIDVNEPPKFTKPDCLKTSSCLHEIYEGQRPGVNIDIPIAAEDPDKKIRCQLTYGITSLDKKYFNIDKTSGKITTKVSLDREIKEVYDISVTVYDCGNPKLSDTKLIKIRAKDVNDNDPKFLNKYSQYVREDTIIGAAVLKVTATDSDKGDNAKVTYSLRDNNFKINSNTGEITLSTKLDYESSKKSYKIRVTATDKGVPQGFSETDVMIYVTDANDNAPIFSGKNTITVDENIGSNENVMKITASDKDSGVNRKIKYAIKSGNTNNMFRITSDGQLKTRFNPDREENDSYKLTIEAEDLGKPSQRSQKEYDIMIRDVNDNKPKFLKDIYELTVKENTIKTMKLITVSATDEDTGPNSEIEYSIEGSTFGINKVTGDIGLHKQLSFGEQTSYELLLTATDKGNPRLSGKAIFKVKVEDTNDYAPIFNKSSYTTNVKENVQLPHKVISVIATDKDTGPSGNIIYTIEKQEGNVFYISKQTGVIYAQKSLDYETITSYKITIKASDQGNPLKSTSVDVVINIDDVNDNEPYFQSKELEVKENEPKGKSIHKLIGNDKDSEENGKVKFTLLSKNLPFEVSPDGDISIKETLDREKEDFYKLSIKIEDNGTPSLSSMGYVSIYILDHNDNKPTFKSDNISCYVPENSNKGTYICDVVASDDDIKDNGRIRYFVKDSKDISINEVTGKIKSERKFDREIEETLTFTVNAEDYGNPKLAGKTQVTVYVTDVNDNAPKFTQTTYTADQTEEIDGISDVIEITASDKDDGKNGIVDYTITSGDNKKFSIRKTSNEKIVIQSTKLDREEKENYKLTIKATDQGYPSLSSFVTVDLNVIDINDHAPKFTSTEYTMNIAENVAIGTFVLKVTAHDSDKGDNGKITYEILPATDVFKIDPQTGKITLKDPLDFEKTVSYSFTVSATDNGKTKLSSTAKVIIHVTNVDDNAPEFGNITSVTLSEDTATGQPVVNFNATDKDKSKLVYDIVSGNEGDAFIIGKDSGILSLNKKLDRETRDFYNITVSVKDESDKEVQQTLPVIVSDVNDNAPKFLKNSYTSRIKENTIKTIETVNATDNDIGVNKEIEYTLDSESLKLFKIEKKTGKVSPITGLDREMKDQHVLTVVAADRGIPSLSSSVKLIVDIEDLNDNKPQFEKLEYKFQIKENTPMNSTVFKVHAYDSDAGDNGKVSYRTISGDIDTFEINNNGEILTKADIDYEKKTSYKISIEAFDHGSIEALKSQVTVSIDILDVNDNVPEIVSPDTFSPINEKEDLGKVIGIVKATDKDNGDNAVLKFSLLEEGNIDYFKIDENSGELSLNKKLDREYQENHNVTVVVKDQGKPQMVATKRYVINVLDDNDNEFFFNENMYESSIDENLNTTVNIFNVSITDQDLPQTSKCYFYLMDHTDIFSINNSTGEFFVIKPVDFEKTSVFNVTIQGTDLKYQKKVAAIITVNDLNDNSPIFTPAMYYKTIAENHTIGVSILQVNATDVDFGDITYTLDNDGALPFDIDRASGVVRSLRSLDRETKGIYNFKVNATDSGVPARRSSTNIQISLSDINDNAPKFTNDSLTVYILENSQANIEIASVQATDADKKREANSIVRYIAADYNNQDFKVDSKTGKVMVLRSFDREKQSEYSFKLHAKDLGKPPLKSDVYTINVIVTDVNDNVPKFSKDKYTFSMNEHLPDDTFVVQLKAEDKDINENGLVRYSIENKERLVSIDPITGVVTAKEFDREMKESHIFKVTAHDNGNPSLNSTVDLIITVKDINDNAPMIDPKTLSGMIQENVKGVNVVADIDATDADAGTNAELMYSIANQKDLFSIDPDSGVVKVLQSLDREEKDRYEIIVIVQDKGSPSLKSNATLVIAVGDEDDNCPVFDIPVYTGTIIENADYGTFVLQVSASDRDIGKNAALDFGITNSVGGAFTIDPKSGNITVIGIGKVDFEYTQRYHLKVRAGKINCGIKSNNTNTIEGEGEVERNFTIANVYINTIDTNDNAPTFLNSKDPLIFSDAKVKYITTLNATDPDLGKGGEVKYRFLQSNRTYGSDSIVNHVFVEASDNGVPPLKSIFEITVQNDITCNKMRFDVTNGNNLTVQTLCSVKILNESFTIKVGETVQLTCTALGNEVVEYRWSNGGELVSSWSKDSKFIINQAKLEDAGTYTCMAYNGAGNLQSESINIKIEEPPYTVVEAQSLTVSIGEKAVLKFLAKGVPEVRYQWYKDATKVPSRDGGTKPDLVLSDAIVEDTAEYFCEASNSAGKVVSKTVFLRVVQPDTVVTLKIDVTNKDREVNCTKFFVDDFQKGLKQILKSEVAVTNIEKEDRALCNITACSKNPCQNGGKCEVYGLNSYQCVCLPSWTGVNCEKDLNECSEDSGICYGKGTCENSDGSFKCNCPDNLTGRRCEYEKNACSKSSCNKETQICVPSSGSKKFSCIDLKAEVKLLIDEKQLLAQHRLELEDQLNQKIKTQQGKFYAFERPQSDFGDCKLHIKDNQVPKDGKTLVDVVIDCLSENGNYSLIEFTPPIIKRLCRKLLEIGSPLLECGRYGNFFKQEKPKTITSSIEVMVVVNDEKGNARNADEAVDDLKKKLKKRQMFVDDTLKVTEVYGKPETLENRDDEKDNTLLIVIVVVCALAILLPISIFIMRKRKHGNNKHSMIMEQRSVMSHTSQNNGSSNGFGRQNLAYDTGNSKSEQEGFMFEMPPELKSAK